MKSPQSATQMIRHDHGNVTTLFHQLQHGLATGARDARDARVRTLCAQLEIHAQLEEEIFYPALRGSGVQSPALERSTAEHDQMRQGIARLRSLCADDRTAPDVLADALNALVNGVMHHVADEETQVLPAAERFLGSERLEELGSRMAARRAELAKPRAADLAIDLEAPAKAAKAAIVTTGALIAGGLLFGRLRRWRAAR